MKKIILILGILAISFTGFAQRTLAVDTLQGAETVSFEVVQGAKLLTAVCTQLGGTSDGTLTLYGSIDNTNWTFLNFVGADLGVSSPKASITGTDLNQITITSGLVASWKLSADDYIYHKLVGVGTSGDTTKVAIMWTK